MPVAKSLPALAVAGLLAFALAGCGGGGDSVQTVRKAAATTLAQTASVTETLERPSLFGPGHARLVGKAVALFPSGLEYVAVDVPEPGGAAARRWFLTFTKAEVFLARSPGLPLPAGKTWLGVAPGEAPLAEPAATFVAQAEALNPHLLLDEIAHGAVTATRRGERVVAHVPYARYEVTVDLSRALGSSRGAERAAIQRQLRGGRRLHVTVLVDGPGRIASLQTADGAGGVGGLGGVTATLSGFGVKVEGTLPPADQVADLGVLGGRSPWSL